jgi:hypothetical protein
MKATRIAFGNTPTGAILSTKSEMLKTLTKQFCIGF